MTEHDMMKALEIWTLQNLLNVSIMLGILASGLALVQGYYRSLEERLSLRVSIELWRVLTVLAVDFLLVIVVLIGYLVLNPDIMADIKIAVPFCPVATILFAIALCLRLFHGGHDVASPNFVRALYLMFLANLVNIIGFTFVMEAASGEYLEANLGPAWEQSMWVYLKTHLRSNVVPDGLALAQSTFYICFPILLLVVAWGAASGLRKLRATNRE